MYSYKIYNRDRQTPKNINRTFNRYLDGEDIPEKWKES